MTDKTILIAGGIGAAVVIVLLLAKKSQQQQAAQQLVLSGQYAQTPAGQVGGILASVGSFFNSGALQSLSDSFLDTGSSNEAGLVTPPGSAMVSKPALSNQPGLNSSSSYLIYGPATPSDLNEPGLTDNSWSGVSDSEL